MKNKTTSANNITGQYDNTSETPDLGGVGSPEPPGVCIEFMEIILVNVVPASTRFF